MSMCERERARAESILWNSPDDIRRGGGGLLWRHKGVRDEGGGGGQDHTRSQASYVSPQPTNPPPQPQRHIKERAESINRLSTRRCLKTVRLGLVHNQTKQLFTHGFVWPMLHICVRVEEEGQGGLSV